MPLRKKLGEIYLKSFEKLSPLRQAYNCHISDPLAVEKIRAKRILGLSAVTFCNRGRPDEPSVRRDCPGRPRALPSSFAEPSAASSDVSGIRSFVRANPDATRRVDHSEQALSDRRMPAKPDDTSLQPCRVPSRTENTSKVPAIPASGPGLGAGFLAPKRWQVVARGRGVLSGRPRDNDQSPGELKMRFGFFDQLPCASGFSERQRYRDIMA